MNLAEIEKAVASIRDGDEDPFAFLYALLRAYGLPQASISRLKNGSYDKSEFEDERLWKGKVYFRHVNESVDKLLELIEEAKVDAAILKQRPRFLILRNDERLLAWDLEVGTGLNIDVAELADHTSFFLPWAGIEKTAMENVNLADVKAAEKMARLYDEIVVANEIDAGEQRHDLNVFFSRLLFCFFAEDTGVFEPGSFTNAIGSSTSESGEDLGGCFDRIFTILNTAPADREGVPAHLAGFGYVNGSLFDRPAASPRFTAKARSIVLEFGQLDWGQINPDIFGSMMQGIARSGERESLGMHYTSVENIMKVIRPLFLEDLEERFQQASDNETRLKKLLEHIAGIQVFDPACGSGNFLVIAYKELRRLEHKILQQIQLLNPQVPAFKLSGVSLENFYGIEIEDFPCEIAALSLWLAKHQMNREFEELFGSEIPLIPLKDGGSIINGNAARLEWTTVCDPSNSTATFVLGNPPYQGGTRQGPRQKADLALAFSDAGVNKYLDYVSIWLFKGANYVTKGESSLGFVTTNSVVQGNHVAMLWPRVIDAGAEIAFAHAAFPWTNEARGKAGVSCVVIGLEKPGKRREKPFFDKGSVRKAERISPYLVPDGRNVIVEARRSPIGDRPPMVFGSMPRDGGHLILSAAEADALVRDQPEAAAFLRRFGGAQEAINGNWRACLWIEDGQVEDASHIPEVERRLSRVRAEREVSKADSTRAEAEFPYRFVQRAHKESAAIMVPRVSSERRDYIPMSFVGPDTVISDSANAIYDAEPWLFGLIQSRMHMVWVRAVAGRLESRYRYSQVLVYNTFPIPSLTDADRDALTARAVEVLTARERELGKTLAELYDPDKMPAGLRAAHEALDETVDRIYQDKPFDSDDQRLELLFEMYEEAVAEEAAVA